MDKSKVTKYLSYLTMAVIVVMMMAATVIEKAYSTDLAFSLVYHSPVFIILWAVAAVSGLMWAIRTGLPKRPVVFVMHISFLVILCGALVSHLTSDSGVMHIRVGEKSSAFESDNGEMKTLPFTLKLDSFEVNRYPGSMAALDYTSHLTAFKSEDNSGEKLSISMNKILKKDGYRLYQSSYDEDENGTILSVSHDPYGITITYAGYFLLFISLLAFFFVKETAFRKALSRLSKASFVSAILILTCSVANAENPVGDMSLVEGMKEGSGYLKPKVVPEEVAAKLGDLYVYYNGRMVPLQTLARDYVSKVYGKPSVYGFTSEQVLSGWMFWFDTWKNVPVKLKDKDRGTSVESEKYYVIQSVASLRALRIFPYKSVDAETGEISYSWLSSVDSLPIDMPEDEWMFVRKVFSLMSEYISEGDYESVAEVIDKIAKYQKNVAYEVLPSDAKVRAEKLYNKIARPMPQAMACVTLGMILFVLMGMAISAGRSLPRWIAPSVSVLTGLLAVYLTVVLALRWYISGHVPMTGGFEMMLLIAWVAMIMVTILYRKMPILQPLGLVLTGFALLVAVLGESNPQITPLMPVLGSPLLSIHVASMMISYTLLGIAALNGIMGVCVRNERSRAELADVGLVILYPGVFLLVAGTFLGAIWAEVSWGSYWMWDPKETWALVTCLVYASAFHMVSIKAFRNPKFFHWFCIVSFMCVLVTYFGVNFILGGMHSYAG